MTTLQKLQLITAYVEDKETKMADITRDTIK